MNNSVLKKAFIEAQLDIPANGAHEFSREFDMRMERLIRMQSGVYRLINTAGKRAAGKIEAQELGLPVESTGLVLPCGSSARFIAEE